MFKLSAPGLGIDCQHHHPTLPRAGSDDLPAGSVVLTRLLPMSDSARQIENLMYTYAERIDAGSLEGVADLFTHGRIVPPPTPQWKRW